MILGEWALRLQAPGSLSVGHPPTSRTAVTAAARPRGFHTQHDEGPETPKQLERPCFLTCVNISILIISGILVLLGCKEPL